MKLFKIWLDENFDVIQNDPAGLKAINSNVDAFEVQSQSQLGHEMVFSSDQFVEDITYPMTFDRQETIDGVINYYYKLGLAQAVLPVIDQNYEMDIQVNARDGAIDEVVLSTITMPYKVIKQLNGAIVYIPVDVSAGFNERITNIEINKYDKPTGASNVQTELSDDSLVVLMTSDGQEITTTYGNFVSLVDSAGNLTGTYQTATELNNARPPQDFDPNDPFYNYDGMKFLVIDSEGQGSNSRIWEWNGTSWFNTEQASEVGRVEFDALKSIVDSNVIRINDLEQAQPVQDSLISDNQINIANNQTQIAINTNKNNGQDTRLDNVENQANQNTQDIANNSSELNNKVDKANIDTTILSSSTERVPASGLMESLLANKPDSISVNGNQGILAFENAGGSISNTDSSVWILDNSGGGSGSGKIYNLAQAGVDYAIVNGATAITLNYATTEPSTDPDILTWDNASGVATLGLANSLYEINLRGQINKGGQQDSTFTAMLVDADTGQMVDGQLKTESIEADNDSTIVNMIFKVSSDQHSKVRIEVSATGNDLSISAGTTNEIEAYTFGQSSSTMLKSEYDQNGNGLVDNADLTDYLLTINFTNEDNLNAGWLKLDSLIGDFSLALDRNGTPYVSLTSGFNELRVDIGDANSLVAVNNSTNLVQAILENWRLVNEARADIDKLVADITRADISLAQLNDSDFTRNQEEIDGSTNILITNKFGTSKMKVINKEDFLPVFAQSRTTTYNIMSMGEAEFLPALDYMLGDNPAYMVETPNSFRVVQDNDGENLQFVGKVLAFENLTPNRFEMRINLTREVNGTPLRTILVKKGIEQLGDQEIEINRLPLQVNDIIDISIADTNPTGGIETIEFDSGLTLLAQGTNHRGFILQSIESYEFGELNTLLQQNRVYSGVNYGMLVSFDTSELTSIGNENWVNDNTSRYTNLQMISGLANEVLQGNGKKFEGQFLITDTFTLDENGNPKQIDVSGILIWDRDNDTWSFMFNGKEIPLTLDLTFLGNQATGQQVVAEIEKWYANEPDRDGFQFILETIIGKYVAKIRAWDGVSTYQTNGDLENRSLNSDTGETKSRLEIVGTSTTILTPLQSRLSGADPLQDSDFATKRYVDTGVQEAKDYTDTAIENIPNTIDAATNIVLIGRTQSNGTQTINITNTTGREIIGWRFVVTSGSQTSTSNVLQNCRNAETIYGNSWGTEIGSAFNWAYNEDERANGNYLVSQNGNTWTIGFNMRAHSGIDGWRVYAVAIYRI